MMGSLSEFQKARPTIASTETLQSRRRSPPSRALKEDDHIPLCDTVTPLAHGHAPTLPPSAESH